MLETLGKVNPGAVPVSSFICLPLKLCLCTALISSLFKMDQKVYRRISDNIYKTQQEHNDAHRLVEQMKKNKLTLNLIFPKLPRATLL